MVTLTRTDKCPLPLRTSSGAMAAAARMACRCLWAVAVVLLVAGAAVPARAASGGPRAPPPIDATSSASTEGDGHLDHAVEHEFELEFDTAEPLGLLLDERLTVNGFRRSRADEMGPAEATGWLQVGDRVVAVNERSVEGQSLRELVATISAASLPRIIRFHTRRHNDRVVQMQREMAAAETNRRAEGTLRVTHQDLPQGEFTFVQALFGGPPSCTPLRLVVAKPAHACGEMLNEGALAGAIVVVERGMCAFSDKAINVQMARGAGILVLNSRGPAFRMPVAKQERTEITVSAVMVGEHTAAKLLHVMEFGLQPLEVHLEHDDRWCKETRNVSEAFIHPDAVRPSNLSHEDFVVKEFDSGQLLVAGADNPTLLGETDMEVFEYLRAQFGSEPIASVPVEVDEMAEFRASNYMIPEGHGANDSALNATGHDHDVSRTSGALRLVLAEPASGCRPLGNRIQGDDSVAVLLTRGECAFEVKQRHAAAAGAVAVVVANDQHGLMAMQASSPSAVEDDVAAVMVTESAGVALRSLARAAGPEGLYVRFRGDARIKSGWIDIQKFIEQPHLWPKKARSRRKVYFRMSRLHHPDKPGGSQERFEALSFAYRLGNHHYNPGSKTLDDIL